MAECGLSYDGNELYWKGSLDDLKEFVHSKLKLDGSWSSPGGDVKLFTGENISLKWQGKHKQKLAVISNNGDQDIGEELIKLAVSSKNINPPSSYQCEQEANMAVDRDCSISANSNSAIDDLRKQMLDLAKTVENKIETLRREVHKLDAKIEPMQILECSLSDLKRDKMRLLQDNNELRERNLNLCLITSDLNTRIKDLERERDSLVTALKLQQQDFEQNLHNNANHSVKWQSKTVSRQKEDRSKQQNLNMQNRFISLNDELGDKSEQLNPRSPINVDSAHHNVDKHHNLNLQNSFVSIDDNEGEENHLRSVIDVDIIQSTSDHHINSSTTVGDRVEANPTRESIGNTVNSTTVGDQVEANQTREPIRNRVRTRESEQDIVIIGDSIIKHISPTKLSKRKVHKFAYPGKTASDINNELSTINIHSTPSHVIVHVGTNNIPLQSADECTKDIEKLIAGVKQRFPNSKIGISGITMRQDVDLASKIFKVNEKIKSITPKYDVTFIDNSSLDKTSLNGSKLHLNAKGSAILASHFISFIKGGQSLRHSPKRSRRDFQMDTMNQLQELLKLISCMNRLTTR